jgi:predicted phage tail protein
VIEASSAPGGPANLANFNTGNALTSLVVPDVPAGTYFVRIRAVSSCGTSAPSSEEQLIVQAANANTSPSAPRGLASSIKGGTVTLTWLAPDTGTVTSYVIQAGSQSRQANLANFDTNSTALTLVASNVPAGSYYIRVYAKNAAGLSKPSNEVLTVVH